MGTLWKKNARCVIKWASFCNHFCGCRTMLPPHTTAAAARGRSVVLQHQYGSKGDYYSCHCKFKIDCMYRLFIGLGNGMGEAACTTWSPEQDKRKAKSKITSGNTQKTNRPYKCKVYMAQWVDTNLFTCLALFHKSAQTVGGSHFST